jgi:hypothetical protein
MKDKCRNYGRIDGIRNAKNQGLFTNETGYPTPKIDVEQRPEEGTGLDLLKEIIEEKLKSNKEK